MFSATIQRGGKMTKSIFAVPGNLDRRCQHREDGWIGVVEGHRVDAVEVRQVVLVGRIVAVPRHHVQRRVIDAAAPETAAELRNHRNMLFDVFVCGHRRQKSRGFASPLAPIGPRSGSRNGGP